MSEEEDRLYSFHHKLFHEFTASRYVARAIEGDEEGFRKLFPDWKTLCDNREVLGFAGEILRKDTWKQIAKAIEMMYTVAVQKVVEECPQTDKDNKINSRVFPYQVQFLEVKQCILPYFGTEESREITFSEKINYVCLGQRTNRELMSISCISMPGNADRYIFAHTVSVHDLKLMLSFHQGITHVYVSDMLKGYGRAKQSNQRKYLLGEAPHAKHQFNDEQLTGIQRHNIKCISIHQSQFQTFSPENADVAFFDSYADMLVNCDSLEHFHLSALGMRYDLRLYYSFYVDMSDTITSDIKLLETLSSIKFDVVRLSFNQVKALMMFVADQINPTKELHLKHIVLTEKDTSRAVFEILNTNVIRCVCDLNVFHNMDIDNPVSITQGWFDCVILSKPTRQCIEINNICLREKARLIVDSLCNGALNKLQKLTLYKCDIPASIVVAIATELECHPCEVNLKGNAFCEIDKEHTNATLFGAIKMAENVIIYPNGATTEADINGAISTELCPKLKHVKLAEPSEIDEPMYGIYDEGMYDECLDALINDIIEKGRMTLIHELDISKSLCSGNKLKDLLKQLHMCSNLKVLKTNENDLCNSVKFLTAEKHDNLHELHMEKCHLVKEDIVALSKGVKEGYFPQLGILKVRFNNVPEDLVTSEIKPPLKVYSFTLGHRNYHYRDIWQKIAAEICFWY